MTQFDTHIMVDWSGGNDAGPKPKADAIWACVAQDGQAQEPLYFRHRGLVEAWLQEILQRERGAGRRVLVGFDFPFGYPRGLAEAVTGVDDPLRLWDWLEARIEDSPKGNNRTEVAGALNALFEGIGPFWGNPSPKGEVAHLPRKGNDRTCKRFPERRQAEMRAKGSFTCWQLAGAGAVGSQCLMGLPVLARLRRRFGGDLAVWPFEPLEAGIALVEIWPSLIAEAVRAGQGEGEIKDAAQVRLLAQATSRLDRDGQLEALLKDGRAEGGEGWILGLGHEAELAAAALGQRLPNDCFALPEGVEWTPVDVALEALRARLSPVTGTELVAVTGAQGRITAEAVTAQLANPPAANAAVDGYGFAHAGAADTMPLFEGRAAAGVALEGKVPPGHAVRILTGAILPEGVDTVVMQEDCSVEGEQLRITKLPKAGANARAAGEDMRAGEMAVAAGVTCRPQELALMTALGVSQLRVRKRLRVGVMSTGDELLEAGQAAERLDQTYDANRPLLLGLAKRWGYEAVDLGQLPDDRDAIREALDTAASSCDVVLASGGASTGDEDHVSALLFQEGHLTHWRIAIKPGRPLALAMWQGVPVFGLPGNPVAAFTCALVFARPALSLMAGSGWSQPVGFEVPAAFAKSKKRGRREFLRARLNADGAVEVFASEGSGRISGLSWAEGFVELEDGAWDIAAGDMVRFIPFGSFGL